MIKHKTYAIKIIVLALIICFLTNIVNCILTPKKYFDTNWPTTTTYTGFYQMEKDTIDVLFFGSSHAACSFNPQEIYNNYGIRSYNLGCEQQNLLVSYYWLKEALKYQSPKVVVLDTYLTFEYAHAEALNSAESCTRMAMDAMKWSSVKREAVKAICNNDESQTFNSYLFKNIRFHTRWTSLTEQDFKFWKIEDHYELKGYAPLGKGTADADYQPYADYDTEVYDEMVPLMQEYLDKMVELCEEEDIIFILAKSPGITWNTSKHNTIRKYAEEHGIEFWDMNEKTLYEECGFNFLEDMHDNGHVNVWGASKISDYFAGRLYNEYEVHESGNSEQWRETAGYYQNVLCDCELRNITDLNEYIAAINQSRYTILISSKYDTSFFMNDEVVAAFRQLGFQFNIGQYESYCAVKGQDGIYEETGRDTLSYRGSMRNKLLDYSITATNWNAGIKSSILINDEEYSYDQNGLNIVVYNSETWKIVDRCVFNGNIWR